MRSGVVAILGVVQAQNDLTHAIDHYVNYGADDRMLEAALSQRIKAVAALQRAIEKQPEPP
jgi:hypothetical protein